MDFIWVQVAASSVSEFCGELNRGPRLTNRAPFYLAAYVKISPFESNDGIQNNQQKILEQYCRKVLDDISVACTVKCNLCS
jgi:hypothetical protein